MSHEQFEQRIAKLEFDVRLARRLAATCALALTAVLGLGLACGAGAIQEAARPAGQPQPVEMTLRKLTIVDDQGRPRIVLAQDPADTQRRSRAAGMTIYDEKGSERDRAGLVVGPQGQASFMLIDNQTRGVVRLQSDGDGKGGLQLFKWDMKAKRVHVKTLTFDGEEIATEELGG